MTSDTSKHFHLRIEKVPVTNWSSFEKPADAHLLLEGTDRVIYRRLTVLCQPASKLGALWATAPV